MADRLFDPRDRRVAGADFSNFAELPAQPLHRRAFAAHAQEGAIFVGALSVGALGRRIGRALF